jgi:transglutaminase-like putative cysteine protease
VTVGRRAQPPIANEVPLVLFHLAVAAGFARLYVDRSFWSELAGVVLAAHLLAIATRRSRMPTVLVAVTGLGALPVVLGLVIFGDTTAWGLPTTATWDAARAATREARTAFPEVVTPTEALAGFQLATGLALWFAAWFGDWTAHRMGATFEPLTTGAALFTFCAILGSGDHQLTSAAVFGSAAGLFVACQRAARVGAEQRWMVGHQAVARSMAVSGTLLGLGALAVGLLLGPALPGADGEPLVDWRGRRGDDARRITVSPMVELRGRLVEQTEVLLFEVRTNEPSYWRLTSLDQFDGEIWRSDGSFGPASRQLPSTAPTAQTSTSVDQRVRIRALSAIWVPVAYEAVSLLDASEGLRWDPNSSTLIVESSRPSSDGLSYSVVSRAPQLDPRMLDQAESTDPPEIAERYLELPSDFPSEAADLALEATTGTTNRYERARALQDWFRTQFTYSLDAPAGHGDDALVDFLDRRVGYCEQFAGAYAAMARALGIPARVAVGFTPGTPDPTDPQRHLVLGRHAHAWPEVHFPGIGWVAFEPTPGRGIPRAQGYTGVAPAQDPGTAPASTTIEPTTTSTTVPASTTPSTTAPDPDALIEAAQPDTAAGDDGRSQAPRDPTGVARRAIAAFAALALLAGIGLVVHRRRAAVEPVHPVERWWLDAVANLEERGMAAPTLAETPVEVARRASPDLDVEVAAQLMALAEAVTAARWAPADQREASEEAVATRARALLERWPGPEHPTRR